MRRWLEEMGRRLQRFMIGRYGTDELSIFLLRLAVVIILLSCIPKLAIINPLGWVIAGIAVYRSCSKKITARSRERDWYLAKTSKVAPKISSKINLYKRIWNERATHRYFRCPNCKTMVRVPRGKGRIEITCTKCRSKMIRKS